MYHGYIYILSNPMLPPDCVKVGLTRKSPEHRAYTLSKMAAIPSPFVVTFACCVINVGQAERRLHLVLDEHRVSKSKEFFRVSPETAQHLAMAIAAFENETCAIAPGICLSNTILGAHYQPRTSLRNRKVLYGMIGATVNNSALERQFASRRTVVDGFLSLKQVAEHLGVKKPSAAKALVNFCEFASNLTCHAREGSAISPVFEMVRYRHGHATWRFSNAYREHFYVPED